MSLRIVKPGLLATVQDLGRYGYGKYGVVVSGAMDGFAHRTANWLIGNDEKEAALEITWSGFSAEFEKGMWISITGGDMGASIDGYKAPMWRPLYVRKGAVLSFKRPVNGCRVYLALGGGVDVPVMMGSRSTYLRAGVGGWQGRALRSGDLLPVKPGELYAPADLTGGKPFHSVNWSIPPTQRPAIHNMAEIRVTRGRQFDDFEEGSRQRIFSEIYRVAPQSDRMGYRLNGEPLRLEREREYISESVVHGTVQVPADGQPIMLTADRQTHGGYPKIAQVIAADLPLIAQIPPGGAVRFCEIGLPEAEAAYMESVRHLRLLAAAIRLRLKEEQDAAH